MRARGEWRRTAAGSKSGCSIFAVADAWPSEKVQAICAVVDGHGQTWTDMDRHGQTWTARAWRRPAPVPGAPVAAFLRHPFASCPFLRPAFTSGSVFVSLCSPFPFTPPSSKLAICFAYLVCGPAPPRFQQPSAKSSVYPWDPSFLRSLYLVSWRAQPTTRALISFPAHNAL